MARRRVSFTLAAVIVFFIILLSLVSIRLTGIGNNFPNPVGSFIRQALAPLQSGVTSVTTGIRDRVVSIWNLNQLAAENQTLVTKVDELTKENNQLKQKVLAGMRYEAMANKFTAPDVWTKATLGASVIDRNPSNWYHTLVINRGSQAGVKVNDAIITSLGLVGKVISVTNNTAEVILILDTEGQVSGLV
ncbi:MAG: rod shape-determining protein MreC, partial [Peptococcaceae bacterium]|nr:rod shape-determining protein MreC [Peptococcaceae bacterium]